MSILTFFQARDRARLEAKIYQLQMGQLQLATKITRLSEDQTPGDYKANKYTTYDESVKAISDKYSGTAEWGVLQTGNIIDIRAAAIVGEGVKVYRDTKDLEAGDGEPDPDYGRPELEFARAFFEANSFDHEIPQEYSKEAEIEGKILVKLFWDKAAGELDDKGQPVGAVKARYIPWLDTKYKVTADPNDYLHYTGVKWEKTTTDPGGDLQEGDFVYKKFGGRINQPNAASPKIQKCLTQIDNLDRALRDLREIDWLFSGPIPDFEFETAKDASQAQADIEKMNFKIKKAMAHTGKFKYVQPTMDGVQSLLEEITMLAKMISGATGCPMQALGFPDMMSVRNSATPQLMEILYAATLKERMIWTGVYQEILQKAMAIFNKETGAEQKSTKLDPSRIRVEIPFTSQQTWDRIERVLMPLAIAGKLSDETLIAQIPGIDVDSEMKKLKRDAPSLKRASQEIEDELGREAGEERVASSPIRPRGFQHGS